MQTHDSATASQSLGAKRLTQEQIPDIDLSPLFSTDHHARQQMSEAIYRACTEIGFFYAYNTRIPDTLVSRVYKQSARFHALPDDTYKRSLHKEKSPYKRGWVPLHEEPAYEAGTVSYCSSFDLARELPSQPVRAAYGNLGPNVWPNELPEFRHDVYGYYLACTALSETLFRAFAEALNLESQFFAAKSTQNAPSTMRLLHYPANDGPLDLKNLGISAHTDFECFTLMHQSAPGLQLLTVNDDWVEAPARSNRLIVIIGDMLERWTNGLFKATRHRVVNTSWERYSLIFFSAVDQDIEVAPLAEFVSSTHPPRYAPVTQLQHLSGEVETAMVNLHQNTV